MPKGSNPNSRKNLEKGLPYRFKPGDTQGKREAGALGNKAQAEKLDFVRALKTGLMVEGQSANGNKLTRFLGVINALIGKAMQGDIRAIELILKMCGQMPAEKLEAVQTVTIKDDWRKIADDLGIKPEG